MLDRSDSIPLSGWKITVRVKRLGNSLGAERVGGGPPWGLPTLCLLARFGKVTVFLLLYVLAIIINMYLYSVNPHTYLLAFAEF